MRLLYLWGMEEQNINDMPEPKNVREYYKQELPAGPEWTDLERKKQRQWKRLYRKAYPRPFILNFGKLLADLAGVATFIRNFFSPR